MRGISGSKAKGPIPDGFSNKRLLAHPFEDSLSLPMNLAFGFWQFLRRSLAPITEISQQRIANSRSMPRQVSDWLLSLLISECKREHNAQHKRIG